MSKGYNGWRRGEGCFIDCMELPMAYIYEPFTILCVYANDVNIIINYYFYIVKCWSKIKESIKIQSIL